MGRAPCCDKSTVKKGPWSPEEDAKLKDFIHKFGTGGNWISLPHKAGLKRCGKSCRLRWLNYLRPNIKHGEFSDEEDRVICSLYSAIGSRWSIIAGQLPGRTDNDIKNYWNTKLKKKLISAASNNGKLQLPLPTPPPPLHFSPATFYGDPSCLSNQENNFFFNSSNNPTTSQTDFQSRVINSSSGYQISSGEIKHEEDMGYFISDPDQGRSSFTIGGGFMDHKKVHENITQQQQQYQQFGEEKKMIDSSSGIHGCDDSFLYYY